VSRGLTIVVRSLYGRHLSPKEHKRPIKLQGKKDRVQYQGKAVGKRRFGPPLGKKNMARRYL